MDRRLHRIAAKLAIVPQLTGRSQCVGESRHRFRLEPPLPDSEVAAFEARHGIRLPEEYREFITLLGRSGAGPHYGLLPLSRWDQGAVLAEAVPNHLGRPFPVPPGPRPGPDWYAGFDTPHEPYTGTITLNSQGCTYATLLVVTGPARGLVVNVDMDRQPPYFTGDPGFLAWYERWLDETADGLDPASFNSAMPRDLAELTRMLRHADAPEVRAAVAHALGRPLVPVAAGHAALRAAARQDPSPRVRRSAVQALARKPLRDDEPVIAACLDDGDPQVRAAALRALPGRGDAWHPRARDLLADQNPDVRLAAVQALDESGALTEDELLPLRTDPHPPLRAAVVVKLAQHRSPWAKQTARAGLTDPHITVRWPSVTTLHRRGLLSLEDRTLLSNDPDPRLRARVDRLRPRRADGQELTQPHRGSR